MYQGGKSRGAGVFENNESLRISKQAPSTRRRCRRPPRRTRRSLSIPDNLPVDTSQPPSLLVNLVFHAKALAFDNDSIGMVQDTVEDGGRQRAVVVEDLYPVLVRAVGGDDHRRALIAFADDLEQQDRAGPGCAHRRECDE